MAETKTEKAEGVVEDAKEKLSGNGDGGSMKRLIVPAAAGLGSLAATYAVRKAPDLLNNRLKPKLEEEGGEEAAKVGKKAAEKLKDEGGPMGKVMGKAAEKLGGGGGDSSGKTRRLPIQRWTDVAAPIDVVYERWTDFEEFPKFMHRVLNVENEDGKVSWEEKIWFSRREWEGEITERRKNDRIAWKTTKGTSHKGVVTFHKLDARLTRVMVDMDFHPSGMIEKMASGMRFVKRAVEADLARFKAYVELGEAKGVDYGHEVEDDDESKNESRSRGNGGGEEAANGSGS
jgi:carbon monoxide dehydrogenase subunit G